VNLAQNVQYIYGPGYPEKNVKEKIDEKNR